GRVELDARIVAIDVCEVSEWERDRGVRSTRCRRECRRELRVIERGFLRARSRVNDHELFTALHRLAIPELRRRCPVGCLRDVNGEPSDAPGDTRRATIVCERTLCISVHEG